MAVFRADLIAARFVGFVGRPWRRRHVRRDVRSDVSGPETMPVTLITGASGGIGMAMATEFALDGHTLLLLGRDEVRLAGAVKKAGAAAAHSKIAKKSGGRAADVNSLQLDLLEPEALEKIDGFLVQKGLHVEVLVNNAGIAERDPFLDNDALMLEHVMQLNMEVLTKLTHRYLSPMIERGSGAVINIASIGGLVPGPYQSVYYASKAYVISLTEALAHELRGRGVYIGAVLPGPTKSAFHLKSNGIGSLYLKVFGQMRASTVARVTHRALLMRHWAIITPGPLYMVLGFCMRVIPSSLLVPLMGILYKQRKKHKS